MHGPGLWCFQLAFLPLNIYIYRERERDIHTYIHTYLHTYIHTYIILALPTHACGSALKSAVSQIYGGNKRVAIETFAETTLGGSWVAISGDIRTTTITTPIKGLKTPLITTHEPASVLQGFQGVQRRRLSGCWF